MNQKENIIFIGSKSFMIYVNTVMLQFDIEDRNEVIIKARGKFISRAVDVAEVVTKRFAKHKIEIKDIKTNSEEFTEKEGKLIRTSTIDILLNKKEEKNE